MSNRVTSPTDTSTASIVINELTREHGNAAGVLRLQPSPLESAASSDSRRVTWTEETVDTEHMNKKKSKSITFAFICVIYYFSLLYIPSKGG